MTTNKPEVFRFDCHGHSAPAYSCNKPADNSGEYVRLSDYEALQADYEKLQSEMATVKKVAYGNVELLDQVEALQAECDRLNSYYKNGIDCFANPCEMHSGERTPPFSEFFERYGGRCLICVVDNNKALQGENERLRKAAAKLVEALQAMSINELDAQRAQHIATVLTKMRGKPRNSSAGMDSAAGASHGAQSELNHGVDRSEAQPQLPGTV